MMRPGHGSQWRLLAVLSAGVVLTGCKREKISSYQIPKELPPVLTAGSSRPGSPPQMPAMPKGHIDWAKLPDGWAEKPVTSEMRVANFVVKDAGGLEADLSVVPLPNLAGKEGDLINMWREQIQLASAGPDEIARMGEKVRIGGAPGQMFDMVSSKVLPEAGSKQRIVVAMTTQNQVTWFFKLVGADELVAREKPNFVSFLEGVTLHGEPAAVDPHAGPDLSSMPPPATMPAASAPPGAPKWSVPPGWTATDPGAMLMAKYDVSGGGAEVSVLPLGGDGGGLLMNINRWRGQLQLKPASDSDLASFASTVDAAGTKATLIDMTGGGKRIVGLIVPQAGQTWFYKCMGDPDAVGREKDAFLQFAKSAQY